VEKAGLEGGPATGMDPEEMPPEKVAKQVLSRAMDDAHQMTWCSKQMLCIRCGEEHLA
jgi:hypothetical protein